ncbi:hypothetical protein FEM48_Zijuj04G0170200 [Ziziphus jujuba var. spinosa]|uniref:Uncharacterized protein n=1 Tax=Ziziphus jujuba var. spinosa TaxID=714518 RepID=A0A978VL31_ZIZJJ|nr:hypothetical protein FEM48_Zijuj04G0170200 [Ziziphus jujuba var. spinosa]
MGGQLLDLRCKGKEISLKELEYIHVNKAAKLIEASVVCGAITGEGNEMEVERMRNLIGIEGVIIKGVWGVNNVDGGGSDGNAVAFLKQSSKELEKTARKDLESDKATYAKFMGIEEPKRIAGKLVGQAMEEITLFDASKAAPFFYWADYMITKLAE